MKFHLKNGKKPLEVLVAAACLVSLAHPNTSSSSSFGSSQPARQTRLRQRKSSVNPLEVIGVLSPLPPESDARATDLTLVYDRYNEASGLHEQQQVVLFNEFYIYPFHDDELVPDWRSRVLHQVVSSGGQQLELASQQLNDNSSKKEENKSRKGRLMTARDERDRTYCISNRASESLFNWLCQGALLIKVPTLLEPKPTSLRMLNTGIERLEQNAFNDYKDTLRDFSIENAPKLVIIDPAALSALSKLRVFYILQAPKLVSFEFSASGLHPDLTIIRIQQTALRWWPDLNKVGELHLMNSIDLDSNRIVSLGSKPINIHTGALNLEYNQIQSIEEFTFNNSQIGYLSLNGNRQLTTIHPNAFSNLKNLIRIDLSSTSITQLPMVGMNQLRSLFIRDTYTLKWIPSIYVFPQLELAHLTYSYHCCSFRYPKTHDPTAYEQHLRLQEEINSICANKTGKQINSMPAVSSSTLVEPTKVSAQDSDFEGFFDEQQKSPHFNSDLSSNQPPNAARIDSPASGISIDGQFNQNVTSIDVGLNSTQNAHLFGAHLHNVLAHPLELAPDGSFKKLGYMHNIECGELVMTLKNITCTPVPDAFNPCEDIMGYSVLRVAVWFVVAASVLGNLSVIVVHLAVLRRLTVPKFLQLNLAIADLFMGVYLAMLAAADVTTAGTYFNYAIDWQHGIGCKVAGAVSLFASQLSIFTLCVITFERYYTITYSIDLNMRLHLGWATRIMVLGWCFAFGSAMLPIFADVNSYSKTSICLPMRTNLMLDRAFILVLLLVDSSAFVIIFASYLKMYLLIVGQKSEASTKERTVARRMALLVWTDFACWAPIIFFTTTALLGRPLISVTNSKILIVFFYPLNSMANPFLYVISTRAYRRDLDYLISRWQVWRKNLFRRHNGSYYSNNVAYNGHAHQYHQAGLNAHLGAVAAVTGVANHLRHIHLSDHDLPALNQSGLLNGNVANNRHHSKQPLVSSRKGRYVIRHQILTDKQLQERKTSRDRNFRQSSANVGSGARCGQQAEKIRNSVNEKLLQADDKSGVALVSCSPQLAPKGELQQAVSQSSIECENNLAKQKSSQDATDQEPVCNCPLVDDIFIEALEGPARDNCRLHCATADHCVDC